MADQEPAPAAAGGDNKKKMLLIGIAAVVLVAIGVGAGVMLGAKRGGETADAETEARAPAPAIYASLGDKFVAVLQYEGKQRYLQTSLSAMTHEETVVKALELHAPLIRGRLITLLGAQDFAALRTDQGKAALRGQILATVQEVLQTETGQPGVEQIYFTDFVLQ